MKNSKFTPTEWNLQAVKKLYIDFDLENPTEDKKPIKDEYSNIISEPYTWEEPKLVSFKDGFYPLNGHNMQISMIGSELEKTVENNEKTFLKDLLEVLKATPQHLYNFQTKSPYSTLKAFSEYESLENISLGFRVTSYKPHEVLVKFHKHPIKNKYLIFDSFRYGFDEIDFSQYLFDYVVIDLSEKKLLESDIESINILKKKCEDHNIPFYFKSWGNIKNNPNQNDPTLNSAHRYYDKAGCMFEGKIYHYDPITKLTAPTLNLFDNDYYAMDDFKEYQSIWELKSYLPMMQDDLYQLLKEDIRTNGLIDPILYYVTKDGVKLVIEGHTRLKACIELNLDNFPTKKIEEDFYSLEDIKLWMLKHQFQRRNLSNIEKLELAYLSKDIIEKQANDNRTRGGKGDVVDKPIDTNQEIAKLAGVGKTTVVNYGNVLKSNSTSIIDKMKKGEISIDSAYKRINEKSSNPKSEITKYEIRYLSSFNEGKDLMNKGEIEGILTLDNPNKTEILTNAQKSKLGVLLIK